MLSLVFYFFVERGRGVVPRQSHKLKTLVQFEPPQHIRASVAQWLEQLHHKQEVAGSTPATGT